MALRDAMYSEDIARTRNPSVLDDGVFKLPPEVDKSGNVEYKTKLNTMSSTRTAHLATQLQWRLAEGNGHAIYVVGVHDNGDVVGITREEFDLTIAILEKMARQLDNVRITSVDKRALADMADRLVAEVHITRRNSVQRTEIRTAVLGDHGCGKSTVLGCLTYGESDNGRGKARLNLLRHRHEVESGRTSSITFGTIGFDADRQLLNYTNNHSAELIFQRSRHVVTFIDTCGHSKHLKTTASAVAGYSPQVFCVVVAADAEEITATTRAYLAIAAVLKAPLMVVVTKMDIAVKSHFAVLMNGLLCALDAAVPGRSRCLVTDSSGCESLSCDMMSLKVVPIFTTSAVRTVGFNELTAVLSHARVPSSDADQPDRQPTGARGLFEFHIEHLFSIDAVGTVVTGWVKSGSAQVGSASRKQQLLVGPDDSGSFTEIKVTSIHALRIPTETAEARSSAALAIQPAKPMRIRKGMLVLDAELATGGGRRISNEFTARGAVLNAGLNGSSTVIVHVRSTYHQARVIELTEKPSTAVLDATLGPGNSPAGCAFATVRLRFSDDVHDYMYAGIPIVVRDGPNLAFVGHISDVL